MNKPVVTHATKPLVDTDLTRFIPEIRDDEDAQDFLHQITPIARLTAIQKAFLIAIISDTMAEKPRTLDELATEMRCSKRNLCFIQANPNFNMALGMMMVGVTRGRTHMYVEQMHKLAMKGQFQAIKFMLEYGGTYVKKAEILSKNLNMVVQQDIDSTPESFSDAVDKFLTRMGSRGWTAERLVTRFRQLASEGAW